MPFGTVIPPLVFARDMRAFGATGAVPPAFSTYAASFSGACNKAQLDKWFAAASPAPQVHISAPAGV
ncbi:MAG: hypothetical protein RR825_08050, partial [Ruthenibacterium sp.]